MKLELNCYRYEKKFPCKTVHEKGSKLVFFSFQTLGNSRINHENGTTTPQIKELIGRLRKNNRAA